MIYIHFQGAPFVFEKQKIIGGRICEPYTLIRTNNPHGITNPPLNPNK
jgi:hypothetical protein